MSELSLTGKKLGNYRLERELGRGRMGVVYLATDEALLRPTAVKILSWSMNAPPGQDPERWFLAEARSVARVNHPSVVQIYSVARHGPYCYIAMEYVEGVSADVLVADRGVFPVDRATEVIAQIAGALHLAHSCEVVHRDVKPANVLIRPDGTAKLGDFGMALHVDSEAPVAAARAGTPHYIAPEIWRGEPASPASDIYALGGTYFFLLTGRPPFEASDVAQVAADHLNAEIRAPHDLRAGLPPQCSDIVRRCMAKAGKDRYQSAQELQWDLRGLLRGMELPAFIAPASPASEVPAVSTTAGDGEWARLGFLSPPFGDIDPRDPPYAGEPFASALRQLRERLTDASGQPAFLVGAEGSGRTSLARRLLVEGRGAGPRAYLTVGRATSPGRTLIQRVARAFGALPNAVSGSSSELDGLLDHLRVALTQGEDPAFLVIDGLVAPNPPLTEEITLLARAAASTRYFKLLMVGSPAVADALAGGSLSSPPIRLPPLDHGQMGAYLAGWLRASLAPGAPPIIITPDAALLVSRRAQGSLRRANGIAINMIRLAVASGRRLLSSWEAWSAPDEEGASLELECPAIWPSAEALRIMNECRAEMGAPPRA